MLSLQLLGFETGLNSIIIFATLATLLITLSGAVANLMIEITIGFYNMFRKAVGLAANTSQAFQGDFVLKVIQNETVMKIFWALVIVAAILLILSTIIKTITTEFNFQQGGNAKSKIIFSAFKALALFVVVPVVAILAIGLANWLLGTIIRALEGSIDLNNFGTLLREAVQTEGAFGSGGYFDVLGNLLKIGMLWPIAKKFFGATIGVVMRIYELTVLFVISTPCIGVMPLTEKPYKTWVTSFTGSVLGLFGMIISVNFCVLLIEVVDSTGLADQLKAQVSGIAGTFVKYAFLIAGLSMIDSIAGLVNNAVGGKDYVEAGTKAGTAALGAVKGAFNGFNKLTGAAVKAGSAAKNGVNAVKARSAEKKERLNSEQVKSADAKVKEAKEALEKAKQNVHGTPEERKKAIKDAQKDLNSAKSDLRDAKKRSTASKRQQEALDNLNAAAGRFKDAKTEEEKKQAAKELVDAAKDAKAAGIHDNKINAMAKADNAAWRAMDGGLGETMTDYMERKFDGFQSSVDTINKRGVKVGFGGHRRQFAELQADKKKDLDKAKEEAGKAQTSYDEKTSLNEKAQKDLKTLHDEYGKDDCEKLARVANRASNADKAYKTAQEAFAAGRINATQLNNAKHEFEVAKREENSIKSEFEARHGDGSAQRTVVTSNNADLMAAARESAAKKYLESSQEAATLEKFVKTSEKVVNAPTMVRSGLNVISNLTSAAASLTGVGDSAFGKTFVEIKKDLQTAIPDLEIWDKAAGDHWKAKLDDIKFATQGVLDRNKISASSSDYEKAITNYKKDLEDFTKAQEQIIAAKKAAVEAANAAVDDAGGTASASKELISKLEEAKANQAAEQYKLDQKTREINMQIEAQKEAQKKAKKETKKKPDKK